jgi:hypothetical protein
MFGRIVSFLAFIPADRKRVVRLGVLFGPRFDLVFDLQQTGFAEIPTVLVEYVPAQGPFDLAKIAFLEDRLESCGIHGQPPSFFLFLLVWNIKERH